MENQNARQAGKEYGALAMGVISLMACISQDTTEDAAKYLIEASDVLDIKLHIKIPDLIDLVNKKMGTKVTADEIVKLDPTVGAFV